MASQHCLLKHTKQPFESPAKVFAKLKSKVQREEASAKERLLEAKEEPGAECRSTANHNGNIWMSGELKENQRVGLCYTEAQALTLSPIPSPQKHCRYSDRAGLDVSPEMGGHTLTGRGGLESTAMCRPPSSWDNTVQICNDPPRSSDLENRPLTQKQVDDGDSDHPHMFSPMKSRLRKRKQKPPDFYKVFNMTGRTHGEVKTTAPTCETGTVQQPFTAAPSEAVSEPMMSRPEHLTRCAVFLNKCPPMSPAKVFAYMKEKEMTSQKHQHRSRRELTGKPHQDPDGHLFPSLAEDVSETFADSDAPHFGKVGANGSRDSTQGFSNSDSSEDVLTFNLPKGDHANNVLLKHKNQLNNNREKDQTGINPEETWTSENHLENRQNTSHEDEVQALTLSPILSPRKCFNSLDFGIFSWTRNEIPSIREQEIRDSRRERAPLESTAVSQPFEKPLRLKDRNTFKVSSRMYKNGDCAFDEGLPLDKHSSQADMFSPIKNRLRKRNRQQTKDNRSRAGTRPGEGTLCAVRDHHSPNASIDDVGGVYQSDVVPEPKIPQLASSVEKFCSEGRFPPMSPAKIFASMKERENKKDPQTFHRLRTKEPVVERTIPGAPAPPAQTQADREDETVTAADQSNDGTAVTQSDASSAEDVPIPPAAPQPVLLEDPLVLNSPRVSIPKKTEAVFKRNNWPTQVKFPNESVIYLRKWFLRTNDLGLFVEGIHREENIYWNSSIIAERVSSCVLKTVSGRVYILEGKMNMENASDFPRWILVKFAKGFPTNWRTLYEKFLSESKSTKTKRGDDGGGHVSKIPAVQSVSLSVKRSRKHSLKTPLSCSPPSSASHSNMSRSGRVIKPPLEYWKGGRVILDAHMNMTIHECYDASMCNPDVSSLVSSSVLQAKANVHLPHAEDSRHRSTTRRNKESVPVRKVKALIHPLSRSNVHRAEKASEPPELQVEALSNAKERCGRNTRFNKRGPTTEKQTFVEAAPCKRSTPGNPSTQEAKKRTSDTGRPTAAAPGTKRPNHNPVDLSSASDEMFQRENEARRKKSKGGRSKPEQRLFQESKEGSKRRNTTKPNNDTQTQRTHKPSKNTKKSPPAKLYPQSTRRGRKRSPKRAATVCPQEPAEDDWTEAECQRLGEAVSYYPKHVAGYWEKVARMVGTHSAEECHHQHTSQETLQSAAEGVRKESKKKVVAPKAPDKDVPAITARAGTLKRKQQVRQYLDAMPRDDVDDVFSSAYMQNKRFEMPSMCPSEEHNLSMSDTEPLTPRSARFPDAKTPQCLHITPGMMGSPNRNIDDKYVYQLQKRIKKNRFNVCKRSPPAEKFLVTPSVKQTMKRCGNAENDGFVVWEMFPAANDAALSDSEEEDFYFSEND